MIAVLQRPKRKVCLFASVNGDTVKQNWTMSWARRKGYLWKFDLAWLSHCQLSKDGLQRKGASRLD